MTSPLKGQTFSLIEEFLHDLMQPEILNEGLLLLPHLDEGNRDRRSQKDSIPFFCLLVNKAYSVF